MKESDLNRVINKNFKSIGFSHKISDPVGGYGIENPFDGISFIFNKPYFWESKFLKNNFNAFNFSKIEDHQFENLTKIKKLDIMNISECIIILGYWVKNKIYEFFIFDINLIKDLKEKGKVSILKKEILKLKEKDLSIKIKKEIFDVNEIQNKIIRKLD